MKTSGNILFSPIDAIDSFQSANRFNLWVAARPQPYSVCCQFSTFERIHPVFSWESSQEDVAKSPPSDLAQRLP
ncbi:hypothetical protein A6X21_03730 [Planctopirus hydrillae]|uniref:Uncharacterized protein n=1 Tax=Planctopirus hydrillae TaxID=1841610 RepID=A0A1C3ENG7_9PLAN|nr:hypothetical protein A6X21_03730 [Planctopirus hydrillae]